MLLNSFIRNQHFLAVTYTVVTGKECNWGKPYLISPLTAEERGKDEHQNLQNILASSTCRIWSQELLLSLDETWRKAFSSSSFFFIVLWNQQIGQELSRKMYRFHFEPLVPSPLCQLTPRNTPCEEKQRTRGARNAKATLALWLYMLQLTTSELQLKVKNFNKTIFFCWTRTVINIFLLTFHSRLNNR